MGPRIAQPAVSERLGIYLTEYDRLRAELLERLRIQKEVERSQVLLIGAFVAAGGLILDRHLYVSLLFGSALLFVVASAFFEQEINIALLAGYLHRYLRDRIIEELPADAHENENVLNWERFRHDEFLRTAVSSVLTINRTLLTYLPGFGTLGTYVYLKYATTLIPRYWNTVELMLMMLNVALAVFLITLGLKVPRLYQQVAPKASGMTA